MFILVFTNLNRDLCSSRYSLLGRPEGWKMDATYRSLAYMRPLSIWAIQWARDVTPALGTDADEK